MDERSSDCLVKYILCVFFKRDYCGIILIRGGRCARIVKMLLVRVEFIS